MIINDNNEKDNVIVSVNYKNNDFLSKMNEHANLDNILDNISLIYEESIEQRLYKQNTMISNNIEQPKNDDKLKDENNKLKNNKQNNKQNKKQNNNKINKKNKELYDDYYDDYEEYDYLYDN